MKKVFVEPEMHRIELNLQENIAASTQTAMGYIFWIEFFGCPIQNTQFMLGTGQIFSAEDISSCAVPLNARSIMNIYPKEKVLPYLRS